VKKAAALAAMAVLLVLVPAKPARFAPRGTETRTRGYDYAGLAGPEGIAGIEAEISAIGSCTASNGGHVAAWVGVEAGDAKHWIQAGLNVIGGVSSGNVVYCEFQSPERYELKTVRAHVPEGRRVLVAVRELRDEPSSWEVLVDHERVCGPVHLPGSHGDWSSTATAETHNGVNSYRYRFEHVRVEREPGGAWTALDPIEVLHDRANLVADRHAESFVAESASDRHRGIAGAIGE
jgi:hypothetical protein